jgi:hypothetical protein
MKLFRFFVLVAVLCSGLGTGSVMAQNAVQWMSYRDHYRAMLWFEKYGGPKHLLQQHVLLVAKSPVATGSLRLSLASKTMRLELPLDETGRAVFPLSKQAYDENAELHLNQKLEQVALRPSVSIVIRSDGVYELADLRAACIQMLDYQNWRDASVLRGKKCVGVRFVFSKKTDSAAPQLRRTDQTLAAAVPLRQGVPFWPVWREADGAYPYAAFQSASYLFAGLPDQGQVLTRSAPLAIQAWFE